MINGFFLIDKIADMTSFDVIREIKRSLKLPRSTKIGHAGTLDPFATGLMLIAVGEATKLLYYLQNWDKEYEVVAKFGIETDTLDITGEILREEKSCVTEEGIASILDRFWGEIVQVPPKFSAIKVGGQRAYDLARRGEEFLLKSRKQVIKRLDMISFDSYAAEAKFSILCDKGTYIRTLVSDIAKALGSVACAKELRRTRVGNLSITEGVRLEDLTLADLKPMNYCLSDILGLEVGFEEARRVLRGQSLRFEATADAEPCAIEPFAIYNRGALVSIGRLESFEYSPRRNFNNIGEDDVDYTS